MFQAANSAISSNTAALHGLCIISMAREGNMSIYIYIVNQLMKDSLHIRIHPQPTYKTSAE
jgi:hypothetical protein